MNTDLGLCFFLVNSTLGAIRNAAPYYESIAIPTVIAVFITWYVLGKKNWSNTTAFLFVLHGILYYLIAAACVGAAMLLVNPFILMVLPAYMTGVVGLGAVVAAPMLWWKYHSVYPQSSLSLLSVALTYLLLLSFFAVGVIVTLNQIKIVVPFGNVQYHDTKWLKTEEECFERGGDHFMTVEGTYQVFKFSDGTVKRYDTSI
jgi:hypothetical protein